MKNNYKYRIKVLDEKGAVLSILSFILVLLIGCAALYWFLFSSVVPADKIGIRQNKFSLLFLQEGFVEVGLKPGRHWTIPAISKLIFVPRNFQFVHFHSSQDGAGLQIGRPLEVPTSDGSKVLTDVTLIVRLFPEPGESEIAVSPTGNLTDEQIPLVEFTVKPHAGPRELVTRYTADTETQLRRVAQIAENELRKSLASLSTTDYYNPALREAAALQATEAVNERINADGVAVWATLIRRYAYAEKKIDDQIFAKNLQDQKERLNAAANLFAAAAADTEQTRAEWDARIGVLIEEGQAKVQVLNSEGSLYEARRKAEGDLLIAEAVAGVDSEKARVFSELAGADIYLAREMAPLLETLKGGIVANIDPYDVNDWVNKLTAKGAVK